MDPITDRVFCGIRPTGIIWADRERLSCGDYATLCFLPYRTLILEFQDDCPAHLRPEIEATAAAVQAKRGTWYQITTSGQSVLLGATVDD